MKKTLVKIATIAQVCTSAIFVVMFLLTITGLVPIKVDNNKIIVDNYLVILMIILGVIYLGLSVYLISNSVEESKKISYVKLSGSYETISVVNSKIIRKIAMKVSKVLDEVKVTKVAIYSDGMNNFSLTININLKTDDIAYTTEKFRLLLIDSFANILDLKFSSINFKVKKMKSNYVPDVKNIEDKIKIKRVSTQENEENIDTNKVGTSKQTEEEKNEIEKPVYKVSDITDESDDNTSVNLLFGDENND